MRVLDSQKSTLIASYCLKNKTVKKMLKHRLYFFYHFNFTSNYFLNLYAKIQSCITLNSIVLLCRLI